jgi:NAD(P)-dependent dehydrogenase (short-subunit alcohol dehydrogenase family)
LVATSARSNLARRVSSVGAGVRGFRARSSALRADALDVLALATHTGKLAHVARTFASAIERFGAVDVVVNDAATNRYSGPGGP